MLAIVHDRVAADREQEVAGRDVLLLGGEDVAEVVEHGGEVEVAVDWERVVPGGQEGIVDVDEADVEVATVEIEGYVALVYHQYECRQRGRG